MCTYFFARIDAQNGLKSENVFRKKKKYILEFLLVFTCLKSTYTDSPHEIIYFNVCLSTRQ